MNPEKDHISVDDLPARSGSASDTEAGASVPPNTAPTSAGLSLYQIERELDELLDLRDEAAGDGALPAELAAIDKQIAGYFSREVRKVDGIAHAINTYLNMAEAADKEADRMKQRAIALEARANQIKHASLYAMQAHGITKLETPTNRLRVKKNGGKEPLYVDPERASDEYTDVTVKLPWRIWISLCAIEESTHFSVHGLDATVTFQLDLSTNQDRIREALRRGESVPGAKLLPRGVHLRVE